MERHIEKVRYCAYRIVGPVVLDESETSLHADIANPAESGELVIEIPLTEAGTAKRPC
jgi:hypothetical protein